MSYRVKLNVFEGPFDLLVYLIEHAQMNIYDIKISQITNQYIAYIEEMKNADIALSSEFMVLAAELLEIKSKMLLPRTTGPDEDMDLMEDPRTELVAKLVDYKRFKDISEMLEMRGRDTALSLEKPQEDLSQYTGEADEYLSLDIDKFVSAFELFLQRKKRLDEIKKHHVRSEKQRLTAEMRMESIKEFFRGREDEAANFKELVEKKDDKYDVAVTFSSVLEMMKERRLDGSQEYLFGDIEVRATEHLFEDNKSEGVSDGEQKNN
jgi:segregation and condensation protein A